MINKRLKDVIFSDQWSELCMDRLSPFGYVLVSKELNLIIFVVVLLLIYASLVLHKITTFAVFFIRPVPAGGVPAYAGSAAPGFL